jgi:hypothetical protein
LLRLNTAFAFPLNLVCIMLSGSVILAPVSLHPLQRSQRSSDSQAETSLEVSPWDLRFEVIVRGPFLQQLTLADLSRP